MTINVVCRKKENQFYVNETGDTLIGKMTNKKIIRLMRVKHGLDVKTVKRIVI